MPCGGKPKPGHAAGDDVLQIVGEALGNSVRYNDAAGRLGGDDLAVLLPNFDPSESSALAERVMTSLTVGDRKTLSGRVSIGLALFPTPPGDT